MLRQSPKPRAAKRFPLLGDQSLLPVLPPLPYHDKRSRLALSSDPAATSKAARGDRFLDEPFAPDSQHVDERTRHVTTNVITEFDQLDLAGLPGAQVPRRSPFQDKGPIEDDRHTLRTLPELRSDAGHVTE